MRSFPGSLARPASVAVGVGATGVVVALAALAVVEVSALPLAFVYAGVPLAGSVWVASALARGRAGTATVVLLGQSVVQALGGAAVAGGDSVVFGAVAGFAIACAIGVAFLPLWLAALFVGRREDLEAGDTLLGLGGAWLAGLHLLAMAVASANAFVLAPGVVVGLGAIAAWVLRADARRRWCARVSRGEIAGYRASRAPTDEERGVLPLLYGTTRSAESEGAKRASGQALCVIERVAGAASAYRDARLAIPVAVAPLAPVLDLME